MGVRVSIMQGSSITSAFLLFCPSVKVLCTKLDPKASQGPDTTARFFWLLEVQLKQVLVPSGAGSEGVSVRDHTEPKSNGTKRGDKC